MEDNKLFIQRVLLGFIILVRNQILLVIVIFITNWPLDSQIFAFYIACLAPNSPIQFKSSVDINHVRLITLNPPNEMNSMTFTVPFRHLLLFINLILLLESQLKPVINKDAESFKQEFLMI